MAISRWCAALEPEVWTVVGMNGAPDTMFPMDQHRRCQYERSIGHDDPQHRRCCWGELEAESRDCSCPCHAGEPTWKGWQVTLNGCERHDLPSLFVPEPGRRIPEQLADLFRERIRSGELAPGDKVPSISQMCMRYRIGATTVRKVRRIIKGEGLVHETIGEGMFVSERSAWSQPADSVSV